MIHAVYVVEDHELMRNAVVEFVNLELDLHVDGEFSSAEEFLGEIDRMKAGLVLIDTSLGGMTGIELVKEVVPRRPDLLCLIYSAHSQPQYIDAARAAGAKGYAVKGDPKELPKAIRCVLDGDTWFPDTAEPEE